MKTGSRPLSLLLLAGRFLLAVGGAWAWFHVAPRQFPVSYQFEARNQIPGWNFRPEPVSQEATAILATTNLFNGTFVSDRGERVTVFVGTWDAKNKDQMSVVGHTPDVCWVGAGWSPVEADVPEKLRLSFGTEQIPFELRPFQAPDKRHLELTTWCTLVSGQVFEEAGRFIPKAGDSRDSKDLQAAGDRHTFFSKFFKVVRDRIAGSGQKQFIRFSTSLSPSAAGDLARLKDFGEQWLKLDVLRTGP